MKLLRVDLCSQTARIETRSDELIGGRRLTAELVAAEVDPGCDPLSADNILVWATGPLAGWRISCGDRLSLGRQEPADGRHQGEQLGRRGGRCAGRAGPAGAGRRGDLSRRCAGVGGRGRAGGGALSCPRRLTGDCAWKRWRRGSRPSLASDYALIAIGPAGEMQLPAAAVCTTDMRGDPFRFLARGGLAAVMGSKGLKAILVRKGQRPRPSGASLQSRRPCLSPGGQQQPPGGGAAQLRHGIHGDDHPDSLGALPTRNFSQGAFEEAERISGEALHDLITTRGGEGTPTEAVHGRLHHPVLQHCARRRGQAAGGAAGIRDPGDVRLEPGHRRPGHHRPHQPGMQRPGPGHHRGRRDVGRRGRGGHAGIRRRGAGPRTGARDRRRAPCWAGCWARGRPPLAGCWACGMCRRSRARRCRPTIRGASRARA